MDILLQMTFDHAAWENAIEIGRQKGIDKGILRQLCKPEVRAEICNRISTGKYEITPPHQALIPKDNGEYRTVYVNEGIDRILLSIVNDLLFVICKDMIHPSCTSYQKGIGCGKVVKNISSIITTTNHGWKADLSKYFDSVPIEFIDKAFDMVESKVGKSSVIDMLRKYYHSDYCFDPDGNLIKHYQSLKQGCAVASWLADVMLYHIDEQLSELNGYYVRYSDDTLFVGTDSDKAMQIMSDELNKMQMKLNPKKVEYLSNERWFKFLGYSIKGREISISKNRLKTFQKEIESRTIKCRNMTLEKAINKVQSYLYKGNGEYAWATQILSVVNNEHDINEMNNFVMDCLRAVATGKKKVGGLGYVPTNQKGVVIRGLGRNVKANRNKTSKELENFKSLSCMRMALITDRAAYDTIVRSM